MRFKNNQNGVTLVELVISLLLISLIAVALVSVLFVGSSAAKRQMVDAQNQAEARKVMRALTQDIKNAQNIYLMGNNNAELMLRASNGQRYRYYIDVDAASPPMWHLYRRNIDTNQVTVIGDNITYINFAGQTEAEFASGAAGSGGEPRIVEVDIAVTNTAPNLRREYYTSIAARDIRNMYSQPYIAWSNDNKVYSSLDGLHWTWHSDDGGFLPPDNRMTDVVYTNDRFVAIGNKGFAGSRIRVSSDGKNWSGSWPWFAREGLDSIAYGKDYSTGNETFVMVGTKYFDILPLPDKGIIRVYNQRLTLHNKYNYWNIPFNQVIYQDIDKFFVVIGNRMDLRYSSNAWDSNTFRDNSVNISQLAIDSSNTHLKAMACQPKDDNTDVYAVVGNRYNGDTKVGGIICYCQGLINDSANWLSSDLTVSEDNNKLAVDWDYSNEVSGHRYVHVWQKVNCDSVTNRANFVGVSGNRKIDESVDGEWRIAMKEDGTVNAGILSSLADVAYGRYIKYIYQLPDQAREIFFAIGEDGKMLVSYSGESIPQSIHPDPDAPTKLIVVPGGKSVIGKDWFVVPNSPFDNLHHVVWGFNEFVVIGNQISAVWNDESGYEPWDGRSWTVPQSGDLQWDKTAEGWPLDLTDLCATTIH